MANALDSYVIRGTILLSFSIDWTSLSSGVTNNIPLLRDIITEKRFVAGDISTKYLPEVYPEGFKGKQLKDTERESLAAIAACIAVKNALRDSSFKQQASPMTLPKEYALEVKLNDFKRNIRITPSESNGQKQFEVRLQIQLNQHLHGSSPRSAMIGRCPRSEEAPHPRWFQSWE